MVAQLTVQQVFQAGYVAFAQGHRLPDYVRRAAWAILACRTAVLGGHTQRCPDGHVQRIWYHSCTHRMCPPCAWLQVERWLRRQQARLLACDHYHRIVTMPAELHGLWLANVTAMTPSKLRDVTSNAASRRLLVNRIRANLMVSSRWQEVDTRISVPGATP
jgi:hypothetical protein